MFQAQKSILPENWEVPQEFRLRLGDKPGRQRLMEADGHLLFVLHTPPQPNVVAREGRFFWRHPSGAWQSTEGVEKTNTIEKHLDEFQKLVEHQDRRLDEATTARDYFDVVSASGPLLRTVRNLHKTLQEARELVNDRQMINLRDRAYELERTTEFLQQDAKNGLDYAVAKRAEEQSESSHNMAVAAHRLNLLAAFFFPLVTLSTVFGVNMKHGLEELIPPLPFAILSGAGVLFGGLLMLFMSWGRKRAKPRDYESAH